MIINSVRLRNFKSHADTEVKFGPGINVILGQNGAGKTSIFEAISFALFKEYSGNIEDLVRRGQKEMSVSVVFTSHGKAYRVIRKRTKNATDSNLFIIDGTEKEMRSGDSGVDEEISSILGIDRHIFMNAIYVRQGEIEKLLTETPSRKKQIIGRLLGIESVEKVWEGMRPLTEIYRERKTLAEGEIMRSGETERRLEEAKSGIEEVRERMKKTQKSISATGEKLKKAEADLLRLSADEKTYHGLMVRKEDIASRLNAEGQRASESRRHLDSIEASEKEESYISKNFPESWRNDYERTAAEISKSLSRLDVSEGSLRSRLEELEEFSAEDLAEKKTCPMCGSALDEEHMKKMSAEKREKSSAIKKQLEVNSGERASLVAKLDKMKADALKNEASEKRLNELRITLSRKDVFIGSLKESTEKTNELKAGLVLLEKKISGLENAGKNAAAIRKSSEELRSEVSALREAYGKQEGNLQGLENTENSLKKDMDMLTRRKKEHSRLVEFIGILNEIRSLFDKSGLQLELRKRSVPVIEKHIQDFFREFNFEYSDISLSDDYDITLYGPGGKTTSDMISGGERVAAALALRLGIARTLAGTSAETVMLDEPTIFLDEQRRQDLIEVLRKTSVLPQMIVVTHDTAMEDAADSITTVKKSKGVSSA